MKNRGHWFFGFAFVIPVVALLAVLSSLQLAAASVDDETYTLTVYKVGGGDVIKSPDQMTYTPGADVSLTAVPDPDWAFDRWNGALVTTTNPATITMDSDKIITATFIQVLPYTVTVSIDPSIVIVCGGESLVFGVFVEDIPITETLGSFQFTLEYDNTVLTAKTGAFDNTRINVYHPTFYPDGWLGKAPDERDWFQVGPVEPDSNQVQMSGYSTSDPPDLPGPYGNGTVAFYEFDVLPTISCAGSFVTIGVGTDDGVKDPDGNAYHVVYNAGQVVCPCGCRFTVNIAPEAAEAAGCNVALDPPPPYIPRDVVTLIANSPDPCWAFEHWEGDLTGSDNPATITIDDDKVITATFTVPTYTLGINTIGDGSVIKDPDETAYTCGEVVTLTANPAAGTRFIEWSGDLTGSTNPDTITMDSDKAITATFVGCPCLPTWPEPEGGTVVVEDENGDGFFDEGETITITAVADDCYEFTGWTGDLAGKPNPAVITMTADLTFEATFQQQMHTLTVNIINYEGVTGTVTLEPPGGVYPCGTIVTLTAYIAEGVGVFSEWSGDLTGSNNPANLLIDSDKVVTTTFGCPPLWTFDPNTDGGTISTEPILPSDGFVPGTVVTITATPDYCYEFVGWTGDLASHGTQASVAITVTGWLSFSADFSPLTYTLITNVDPVGMGTVALAPDQTIYDCGTIITATATPTTYWAFDYWSGAVTGNDNPTHFVLDESSGTILNAHFTQYKVFLPVVLKKAPG